jgi:hypothetical protein
MTDDEGDRDRTKDAPNEPRRAKPEEPVLPDVSSDELDVGWGDEPGERDDEWYRRERPPHHG